MERGKLSEVTKGKPPLLVGDDYSWIADQDFETAKNLKNTLDKLDSNEINSSIANNLDESTSFYLDFTIRIKIK
jgi:hypothetical protein